ncbi:MAG: chemotaxis protein CheW [Sphingomonadaceae bacterium]
MTELVLVAIVAGDRVAFEAAAVESVVDLWQVVPVPRAPDHLIGLSAVRSRVVTVVDTAACVGLRAKQTGNRAIILEDDGHRYALRVDAVLDVVPARRLTAAHEAPVKAGWSRVVARLVDTEYGFALVLDPRRLLGGAQAIAA